MADASEKARRARSAGCFSALIGIPVLLFLAFVTSLGECYPEIACHRSLWADGVAPAAAVSLVAGLGGYWIARWLQR